MGTHAGLWKLEMSTGPSALPTLLFWAAIWFALYPQGQICWMGIVGAEAGIWNSEGKRSQVRTEAKNKKFLVVTKINICKKKYNSSALRLC